MNASQIIRMLGSLALLAGCSSAPAAGENLEPVDSTGAQALSSNHYSIWLEANQIAAVGDEFFVPRDQVTCAVRPGQFSNGAQFPVAQVFVNGAGFSRSGAPIDLPTGLGSDLLPGPPTRCPTLPASDVVGFKKQAKCVYVQCDADSPFLYSLSFLNYR